MTSLEFRRTAGFALLFAAATPVLAGPPRGTNRYSYGDVPTTAAGRATGSDGTADPAAVVRGRVVGNPSRDDAGAVRVTVEVLVDDGDVLRARVWHRAFDALGVPVRVRRPVPGEAYGVTEKSGGPLRDVTAVARLGRSGGLDFGTRRFAPSDRDRLERWVADLQTYGAAGSPEGQPRWGLTEMQFAMLHRTLSVPAPDGLAGATPADGAARFDLPEGVTLRWSPEADRLRADRPPAAAGADGLSAGTGLSVFLAGWGLAFRPARTPDGGVELVVVPRPDPPPPVFAGTDPPPPAVWPAGWELDTALRRQAVGGALYDLRDVRIPEATLGQVMAEAERDTGVPVRSDRAALARAGVDPTTAAVRLAERKASWLLTLRRAAGRHRLTAELRRDEAGRPLVWIEPLGRPTR